MKGYEQISTDEVSTITMGDAIMVKRAYAKFKARNPKFVEFLKRRERLGRASADCVFRKSTGGRHLKKFFLALLVLSLSACGGMEVPSQAGPSASPGSVTEQPQVPENAPVQPFVFEPVGEYMQGQPIDIIALPNGFWIVATLNGQVYLLNPDFRRVRHTSIPVQTYWDSGLMSAVLDADGRVYFYFTGFSDLPECQSVTCNFVVRYEIDQQQEDFLQNPETISVFPMGNNSGVHNGGGMTFGPDGMLYVAVGDSQLSEELIYPYSQDPASLLGKVHRIDPATLNSEQVALGLRNPFTMIASPEGALIGDVGYTQWEEVNFLPWNDETNFGWPLTEGPFNTQQWPDFSSPIQSFRHCDEIYKDEDPYGHDETTGKALTIKNHAGIVHPCGSEIVAVDGYYPPREDGFPDPYEGSLDGAVIYGEPYYGWIRAFDLSDSTNDRHVTHMPGLMALAEGHDGYLYGVSLFASNYVLRLVPNPEVGE